MSIPKKHSLFEKPIPNGYLLVIAFYCFVSPLIQLLLLKSFQVNLFAVVFPSLMLSPAVALLCASYIYRKRHSAIIISAGIFSLIGFLLWILVFSRALVAFSK
jgi:hypothetical protein